MRYRNEKFMYFYSDRASFLIGVVIMILTFAFMVYVKVPFSEIGVLAVPFIFGALIALFGLRGARKSYVRAMKEKEMILQNGKKYRATITGVHSKHKWVDINPEEAGKEKVYKRRTKMCGLTFEYQDENGNMVQDVTAGLESVSKSWIGKQVDVYILDWHTYVVF